MRSANSSSSAAGCGCSGHKGSRMHIRRPPPAPVTLALFALVIGGLGMTSVRGEERANCGYWGVEIASTDRTEVGAACEALTDTIAYFRKAGFRVTGSRRARALASRPSASARLAPVLRFRSRRSGWCWRFSSPASSRARSAPLIDADHAPGHDLDGLTLADSGGAGTDRRAGADGAKCNHACHLFQHFQGVDGSTHDDRCGAVVGRLRRDRA